MRREYVVLMASQGKQTLVSSIPGLCQAAEEDRLDFSYTPTNKLATSEHVVSGTISLNGTISPEIVSTLVVMQGLQSIFGRLLFAGRLFAPESVCWKA